MNAWTPFLTAFDYSHKENFIRELFIPFQGKALFTARQGSLFFPGGPWK
jgi:hypothetical protein